MPTPHLSGVFLSLSAADVTRSTTSWNGEFDAMRHVGINFVVVRAALVGSSSAIAGGCTLGTYTAFYATKLTPANCYLPSAGSGGTLEKLLDAAAAHNVSVHITPAMPHTPFAWPPSQETQPNKTVATYFAQLTDLQYRAFADIRAAYPQHRDTIRGVYTALEQWNGPSWMSPHVADPLATEYFQALATRVKALDATLAVWASPYYVGNQTLHTTAASAADYGAYWQRLWSLAPSFDWIGLQDARGWQGNSDKEVAQALAALATAAATEKRELWSNIELFEGWPLPCEYPTKCGRHPAPMARIAKQLASEAPLVGGKHIAWEWTSCLSPYTNADTAQLYKDYTAYLGLPALATM